MSEPTNQNRDGAGDTEDGQNLGADTRGLQPKGENSESNPEVNTNSNNDAAQIMVPVTAENSDGHGQDDLNESPVNSLDGLDEIVKADEENNNMELSPKEEVADDLAHIIEAVIFASDEPLSVGTIKSVLDAARILGRINSDMVTARINALNDKYDHDGSGFHIIEVANGYQFSTRKELAQWVSYLFRENAKRKLSNSALETLAIIAYKQPVTKPEIESIRGVNIDYVLHNLLEKEIVTVVGRAETVGRPLLYGTTQRFLKIFGLKNLEDLPKLREIEEIIKEIRSKGAEESIQLEITALGEQIATEPSKDAPVNQDSSVNTQNSAEDGTTSKE